MNWGRLVWVTMAAAFAVFVMRLLAGNLRGCTCRTTDPSLLPVVGAIFALIVAGVLTLCVMGTRRDP